jgi:hypothetical protein
MAATPRLAAFQASCLGMCERLGGVQVGVHGTRLVLHGGDRQVFVGELAALVLFKALVDCPVNRLPHVPGEPLPALAAGGGELLDASLLQALAQLRLAPPLLPVALLPLSEFAMEGAVVLPVAGRQEVGNPNIHADHRGRRRGVDQDDLVVGERQPPAISALVEGHTGIDGLVFERLAVVGSQLDREQQLLAECERADLQPVVKGRVLGGFELDDVGVGLDAALSQRGNVPFFPGWFLCPCIQGALRLLLVVVQQIIRIVLIRLCAIGAPGLGDACCLLDGDPVPAFG